MVITARYSSRCDRCRGRISQGDLINWSRSSRLTSHVSCPQDALERKRKFDEAPIHLEFGSGYETWRPIIGQTVRHEEHGVITVIGVYEWYIREDGLSFGVGDDTGYIYEVAARPATEEEAAPVLMEEDARRQYREAIEESRQIAASIRRNGERPADRTFIGGRRIIDKQTIYGGGDWFEVTATHLWYVRNNGADGDDWSQNNVMGAGAIGWRIPRDEALVERLSALDRTIAEYEKGYRVSATQSGPRRCE